MRRLIEAVFVRPGKDPGDAKKAAALIAGGRAVVGDPGGSLPWLTGKIPEPGDRWFYLAETRDAVVAYAAVGIGYTGGRIPNLQVAAVSVPVGVGHDAACELTKVLLCWIAETFLAAADGRGYVFGDVADGNDVGAAAFEAAGYELVGVRKAGTGLVRRYVRFAPPAPQEDA